MFDLIAARYQAYDLDKFYALTLKQVLILKRAAEKGNDADLELQAKLHKFKVKKPPASLGVTKEQREEYDSQAKDLLKKMKQRHVEEKLKHGR